MHLGGHPRAVLVPDQEVEGRWLLALQPVVPDVLEDEVRRPEGIEGVRHLVGLEVAVLGHLALEPRDGRLVGEDAEGARDGEVGVRVEEGRRLDRAVARRRVLGHADRRQGPAEADRDRVDLRGAGDLLDHTDGVRRPLEPVVLEAELAQRAVGVAIADGEAALPVLDGPLDQALPRREVGDVVLVDPGRAEEQRGLVDLLGLGLVLDQLDQRRAVDHLARGDRHVHAELEAAGVDLRGPAPVVPQVREHVLRAPRQAGPAGVEGLADGLGVPEKGVGRRQRVEQEAGAEARLGVLGVVEARCVEQLDDELASQQVLLLDEEVEGVLAVGGVLEALVPRGGSHRALGLLARQALDAGHGGGGQADGPAGAG